MNDSAKFSGELTITMNFIGTRTSTLQIICAIAGITLKEYIHFDADSSLVVQTVI